MKSIMGNDNRLVGWLCLRLIDSEVIWRRHPNLLSLAKIVKLGKYTVPTRNRTLGRRVTVHYAAAAPHKLHYDNRSVLLFL